jgi:hypothetical protein
MSCPAILFADVDDVLYARLLQQAVRAGAKFDPETEHTMEIRGCVFVWTRTGTTLFVTCTKKPFFVSCDEVRWHLAELIDEAKEAV